MLEYVHIDGFSKPLARLVMGTMILSMERKEESFKLLDDAYELGYTTFDTAHVYGGGDSERVLGEWMETRGRREQVVILSKGAHPNADRSRVTPFDISADLHDSLARLRTGYIDIYLLHRDDPQVAVGPIVEHLNSLHQEGKIGRFGGSNWEHGRIAEANRYAGEHGLEPFRASSPHYSLAEQIEDPWGPGCVAISGPDNTEARRWYAENQMPVFAYSSLARGFFSGRLTPENFPEKKENLDQACLKAYCHKSNFQRLERVQKMAEKTGLSIPQLALAFVLHSRVNVFPLIGAANRREMADNLQALAVDLTPEERDWLDLKSDNCPL